MTKDEQASYPLEPGENMSEPLEDSIMDDIFDDEEEYDMADFNLGYQAGTLAERERVWRGIQKLESQSHATRTPLYQETMFIKIREILSGTNRLQS
jgi:hypothetical protein